MGEKPSTQNGIRNRFMKLNDYQERAMSFDKYPPGDRVTFKTLGLCGESGEVAEKVKKVIRDKNGFYDVDTINDIILELGDVLWYLAGIAHELGTDLETVAQRNLNKLTDRANRNMIKGEGDNR